MAVNFLIEIINTMNALYGSPLLLLIVAYSQGIYKFVWCSRLQVFSNTCHGKNILSVEYDELPLKIRQNIFTVDSSSSKNLETALKSTSGGASSLGSTFYRRFLITAANGLKCLLFFFSLFVVVGSFVFGFWLFYFILFFTLL